MRADHLPEPLHQDMMRLGVVGVPGVGQPAVEQADGAGDIGLRRHEAEPLGGADVMRVGCENAPVKGADIEYGGAGLGADARQGLQPAPGGLHGPGSKEAKVEAATKRQDSPNRFRQINGFPLGECDVENERLEDVRLHRGQLFPAVQMACKAHEGVHGQRIARPAAQHGENHLADRVEPVAGRYGPEGRQQQPVGVEKPVFVGEGQGILHPDR